jgi:hypothetical protein
MFEPALIICFFHFLNGVKVFATTRLSHLSAHGFRGWCGVYFFEHAAHPDQVMIKYFLGGIQQFEYAFVTYGVEDVRALLARDNDIPVAQYGKLLRSVGLLDIETLADLIDGQLTFTQRVENGDPQWVSQCLEEFRLEVAKLMSH